MEPSRPRVGFGKLPGFHIKLDTGEGGKTGEVPGGEYGGKQALLGEGGNRFKLKHHTHTHTHHYWLWWGRGFGFTVRFREGEGGREGRGKLVSPSHGWSSREVGEEK